MSLPTRGAKNSLVPVTTQFLQEKIKFIVSEVFRKHGGTCIITPLLKPKSKLLRHSSESCVQLMTCNGNIVSLPYDLRIPFARYVVFNNISNIRRYAIERVYREKRVRMFYRKLRSQNKIIKISINYYIFSMYLFKHALNQQNSCLDRQRNNFFSFLESLEGFLPSVSEIHFCQFLKNKALN